MDGPSRSFCCRPFLIAAWLLAGIHFGYSNELYQLVVNSATTVITFLMVFLIQNSQNRDTQAIHLKLDELVRVTAQARDEVAGIEERTEAEFAELKTGSVTSGPISGMDRDSGHS